MTPAARAIRTVTCATVLCLLVSPALLRAQAATPQAEHGAAAVQASPTGVTTAPPPGDPHAAPASDHAGAPAAGQPAAPAGDHAPGSADQAAAADHAAADDHGEAAHEGESIWSFLGRLFNFLVLVGGLVYFLKSPITNYLASRSEQIRSDLVNAAATREAATQELAAIDARMKSLPAELEALKARGKEEIAAEQARIKAAADAERQRLVDQARLELEQQTRAARRDLQEYAATLAVDVARMRLAAEMTDDDQRRLVDRYVAQVTTAHE